MTNILKYLSEKKLNLNATTNDMVSHRNSNFVIVAVSTDYDSQKNGFDTSILQSVIEKIYHSGSDVVIVMKSTVPIRFTKIMRDKLHTNKIIFSSKFLRKSKALCYNLYPSRIIVGTDINDEI